jgi:hypothetical protein
MRSGEGGVRESGALASGPFGGTGSTDRIRRRADLKALVAFGADAEALNRPVAFRDVALVPLVACASMSWC